jgi:hypothetical protein
VIIPLGLPSRQEIEQIIALDAQPVLRNLRITQCYHDLSQSIASVVGAANVNWCTFASWASKTAGRFVRGEVVAVFRDALQSDSRLAEKLDQMNKIIRRVQSSAGFDQLAVYEVLNAPVLEVSRHIAAGNLAVFAELGPLFSVMCARFAQDTPDDSSSLARLLDELDLKKGPSDEGGQSLLRSAVEHFYEARHTSEPDRKAELVLFANAETGLHEQVRLQPAIAGSLLLPSDATIRALLDGIFPGSASFQNARQRMREILENAAKPALAEVDQEIERIWRQTATRILMTLRLPDGEIHLGKDLRTAPGRELFPLTLQSIEMNELRCLLATYNAEGDSAAASGAVDWSETPERMHFILMLFRARQQDLRLFEQPFSDAQRRDILAGRLPQGAL